MLPGTRNTSWSGTWFIRSCNIVKCAVSHWYCSRPNRYKQSLLHKKSNQSLLFVRGPWYSKCFEWHRVSRNKKWIGCDSASHLVNSSQQTFEISGHFFPRQIPFLDCFNEWSNDLPIGFSQTQLHSQWILVSLEYFEWCSMWTDPFEISLDSEAFPTALLSQRFYWLPTLGLPLCGAMWNTLDQ